MINKKIFKKKILQNNLKLFLLVIIIFVFLQEFNIFRNLYYLINLSAENRTLKAYEKTFFSGYCKGSSHGYLIYIKNKFGKKFKDNTLPKIINTDGREEYWVFLDVNAKINNNYIILLNHKENIDLKNYRILDVYENRCFFLERIND